MLLIKKNQFLILIWAFLISIVSGVFAKNFGVPQQFLVPEYMGQNNMLSFGILGFAIGGFITGFNLYVYIMHGYRFPFIATLSRPFHKFSLNNSVIPLVFVIIYLIQSAIFQANRELFSASKITLNLLGFVGGLTIFQLLDYFYFSFTNKDASAFGAAQIPDEPKATTPNTFATGRWWRWRRGGVKRHVETYISSYRRISLARDSAHYSPEVLEKVFAQNHINATYFEIALVISFLVIGSLSNFSLFVIPAGASLILFFTIILMLVSAFHSWLKGWTITLFVVLLLSVNFFYSDLHWLKIESHAAGLNYETKPVIYDLSQFKPDNNAIRTDYAAGIEMLENWKRKQPAGLEKPKLVILNHSGGGSRSAFWTMRALMNADSICNGALLDHTILMTGASGGMLGAAYLRELKYRQDHGEALRLYDTTHAERIGRDLLNPILLSMATNDCFIRYHEFNDGPYTYIKDRGYAFEQQLRTNTQHIFDRRLRDYTALEKNAEMPMMILSPTILKDGRRLLISAQPIAYLTQAFQLNGGSNPMPEDIEFSKVFANHDAGNLHFVNALRMNATFPYVLPSTTLPTEPSIEILDAGIRDNFGWKTTMQFVSVFQDWINENTSGVIIVQVRDLPKNKDLSEHHVNITNTISGPIGGIYGNLTKTHDYNGEQMLHYLQGTFNDKIELITFQLNQDKDSHVSLSWHLTNSEKQFIRQATRDAFYQAELQRLKALLGQ
ncbi:MAG: hypothetical protein RLZZ262_2371 [Bacteroidota bacterium]|jgi:hypothetical protein